MIAMLLPPSGPSAPELPPPPPQSLFAGLLAETAMLAIDVERAPVPPTRNDAPPTVPAKRIL